MSKTVLLQTKFLIPRTPGIHISRPHLTDKVLANLPEKLVSILAPPGYGKTTLMVDVVQQVNCPVVWYQLDEGDNDPATFISYLVEGLYRTLPDEIHDLRQSLHNGESLSPKQMLVLLINTLVEEERDWLLVLDDLHLLSNAAVLQLVAELLENRPHCMQVMLSSRTTPSLPIDRWRARNQVTELRAGHLRFLHDEAHAWVQRAVPDIPADVVEALANKTEGWGAGLQLAITLLSEATSDDTENVVNNLGGTHPYIFHYLMEEIFDQQPSHIQDFLLQTSICHQLNTAICRDVIGFEAADAILEQLENDHLFLVRLDNRWYRYHQLFQEFLQEKFFRQNSELANSLNRKLGQYHQNNQDDELALQHFLKANDQISASKLLEASAFAYIEQGRVDSLHHYLQQIQHLNDNPILLYVMGYVLRHQGKLQSAIINLEKAYRIATAHADEGIASSALTQLASIARSQGDYTRANTLAAQATEECPNAPFHVRAQALMEQAKSKGFIEGMAHGYDLAQQAIEEMQHADSHLTSYQQAQLHLSFGQICWWYGNVNESIRQCELARTHVGELPSQLAAQNLAALAIPYLYQHQYDLALEYANRSLEICQELGLHEQLPTAYAVLGNVLTRMGRLVHAETCLRQAIELAQEIGAASYAQVMAGGYLAYNLVQQGRIAEAQQTAEAALLPHVGQTIVYEIYVCRSVLADTYLEQGREDQARSVFEELISVGEERQYRIPLSMAYFGLAYIYLRQEQHQPGIEHALRSLSLLEPTGTWELYVDQGERAEFVCQALSKELPNHIFLQQVLKALN